MTTQLAHDLSQYAMTLSTERLETDEAKALRKEVLRMIRDMHERHCVERPIPNTKLLALLDEMDDPPSETHETTLSAVEKWATELRALATSPSESAEPSQSGEFSECSGDPNSCPENEGYGCCKRTPAEPSESGETMAILRKLALNHADRIEQADGPIEIDKRLANALRRLAQPSESGYRLLRVGERIEIGDQLYSDAQRWRPADLYAGTVVDSHTAPIRRLAQPQRQGRAAVVNMHEMAKSILADEYRRAGFFGAADDACSDTPSPHCAVTIKAIERALRTEQPASAAAADGWRLVPVEATEDMLDALRSSEHYCENCKGYAFDARNGYERMLAAAPDRSQSGGG